MAETVSAAQLVPEVMPEVRAPDDEQRINARPEAFGALIGRGMQQAGTAAERSALDIANFQGEVNVDDQVNQFITRRDAILHGDPNKKTTGPDGQPIADRGYFGLSGRALLDQRQQTLESLEEARQQARANLKSPKEQFEYDVQTRRMYGDSVQRMGMAADGGWREWAGGVNNSSAALAMNGFLRNLNDPDAMAHNASDYIGAKVKEATIKYGDSDEIKRGVIASAKADLVKEQVLALSVNDPVAAKRVLENNKDTAGAFYEPLSNQLRARSEQQTGIEAATKATQQAVSQNHGYNPAGQNIRGEPLVSITTAGGKSVTVSAEGADRFKGFLDTLEQNGAPIGNTGGYNPRRIDMRYTGGQSVWSEHAYGRAIDIGSQSGRDQVTPEFRAWYQNHPDVVRSALNQYGIVSGADFSHPDLGHFELAGHVTPGGQTVQLASATTPAAMPVAPLPTGGSPYALHAAALRNIMDDSSLNENERQHAFVYLNRQFTEAQVAAEADAKSRKDQNDQAMNGYVSNMMQNGTATPEIMAKIASDPALTGEAKENLYKFATNDFGFESSTQFGPAYADAYKRIFAPPGDPNRIGDLNEILQMGAPGGGLTPRGVDRLWKVFAGSRKDPDQAAVNQTKAALINYAKSKLSFEEDTGPIKIRDPKGEQIFNAEFVPRFEAAYDAWIKDGKNPWEFLNHQNVDKVMSGLRPKAEMDRERLAALGQVNPTPEDKNAPLPPTPEGIAPEGWVPLVSNPPMLTTGQQASRVQWAQALTLLAQNPDEKTQDRFNKWFGAAGYDAKDVLAKLKPAGGTAAAAPGENEALGYGPAKAPDYSVAATAGPGPAGHLGDLLRRLTPERVQEYLRAQER